ncbi:MAG: S-adenosylmethionine decarboxylase [Cyclobacteriaceae bacterium]
MKAKIDNYSTWVDGAKPDDLKTSIEALLTQSGFTVLNFMEHHFKPQGYTAVWLLAESHCALHTFPEENQSYVELSSCNTKMYVEFINLFTTHFNLSESEVIN